MTSSGLWENPAFLTRVDEWLLRGKPKQNAIDWNVDPWIKAFPEYEDFLKDLRLKNLGYLGRDIVRKALQSNAAEERFVEGFLAVMIWGYAGDARGPWRAKRILDQPIAKGAIASAYGKLFNGDIIGAYEALVGSGPDYLGPAFATKYLYFASNANVQPQPVILDSLVTQGLKLWGSYKVDSINSTGKQYLEFLEYISSASNKLQIEPEDIELIVFSEIAKSKGNQTWANGQTVSDISIKQRKAWGLLLAAEILLRNPDYVLVQTQPGGGQYDCLSIRDRGGLSTFEADFNLNGSIHFLQPKAMHFNWEELIERGVSSTCELLAETFTWSKNVDLNLASPTSLSLRQLASLAVENIHNPKWDIACLVSDNSAYGQSINHDAFEAFSEIPSDLSDYPEIIGMPKESWFWSINFDGVVTGILDTYKAVYHFENQSTSRFAWSNQE